MSIGLSHNKFLAKIASDLDKQPRGFAVSSARRKTLPFLASRPVSQIWGVGKAMQADLLPRPASPRSRQLQKMEKVDLMRRFGSMGARLYHLARGEDSRRVSPDEEIKSISAETTFNDDLRTVTKSSASCGNSPRRFSRRAKAKGMAGATVT